MKNLFPRNRILANNTLANRAGSYVRMWSEGIMDIHQIKLEFHQSICVSIPSPSILIVITYIASNIVLSSPRV